MSKVNNEKIDPNEIQIIEYLKLFMKNWYWMALSILICCIIAAIYIMITPKVYERKVQIMIKEDAKRNISEPDEKTILKDINFLFNKTNINNEIELLLSEKTMDDVIAKLHLEKCYKIRSGLKYVELYNETPIEVHFLDVKTIKNQHSLTVTPMSENKVKLDNFKIEHENASNISTSAAYFDTVETPLGKIVISPTIYYKEDFIDKSIHVSRLNADNIAEDIRNNITTTTDHENTIVKLSFQDNNIQKADDILNTIIAIYNENNITYRTQIILNTSNFINERLRVIEKELGLVDQDISSYKSSNMITNIKDASYLFLTESSRLDQQVAELQNQLSVAKFIKEYLINPANSNNLIPSNSGINDSPLERQISEYNSLMLKKGRLLENSSLTSPPIVEMTKTLSTMKQSIIRSVDNLAVVYELQIAGIKDKGKQINQKISNVPEKEMDIISIERRLKIQEDLYLYLLQKREENELAGSFITSNFRIVNSAGGSRSPIYPKSLSIMAIAFVTGLLIPSVYLTFKQLTSSKITSPKDILNYTDIPFLGIIPLAFPRKNKQKDLNLKHINDIILVKNNTSNDINEAFRIVRTNISFMDDQKEDLKVIMLTSFNEKAGKSFVALNLAVSFAITNKKTVLIDMNLRNKILSSYLHSPATGLVNYLDDSYCSLDKILMEKTCHPNLDIIPAGSTSANPVELLSSNRLKELVSTLRHTYDHIIIDTTPFDIVADASIIEKTADMTVFILMENLSEACKLPELENLAAKIKNMTLLLNASRVMSYGLF
ncbi:MAG: polysaccharide biosynthesis tyrosine autokinase [Bacteroidales bacterium]|jgi:capsular exopolysaccharide synthesis family protein|nr:polysaccharide biosynthesis tyrosine autokinase [Bacteroidales bacterium]